MTYPGRNILSEAAEAVDGPRRDKYGHPVDNHGCTAGFYTEYLRRRGLLAPDAELTARDVCMLNALQKISRDAHVPDHDNLVDIAGWARNAEIVSSAEGTTRGGPKTAP